MKGSRSGVSSTLLAQLQGLNVVRPIDPFEGCSDLTQLPLAPSPAREQFVAAIVSRLDPTSNPIIPSPYLDQDWPALRTQYLEQLSTRPAPFLIDFINHDRFFPAIISLVRDRTLSSRAFLVLANAIVSSALPTSVVDQLLSANVVPVLEEFFLDGDSLLDAMLHAAELLSLLTILGADRRQHEDAFEEQLQLERAVSNAFAQTRSLYDDLVDPENGLERYSHRYLDTGDVETRQFNWERSPRIVAKIIEFLSKSVLYLHVTATTDVLRRIMTTRSRFEDPSRLVTQAMQCLSENGGVLPALPICTTGMYLSDTLAVITRLDSLFALDHELDRHHYPSDEFYQSCEALWRLQSDCIDDFISCDDAEGSLVHGMVHWIASDPRSKPSILNDRHRFHPETNLTENSILDFIGSVLGTTQSILSCLANISRIRPLLTAVAAELVALYMLISELGKDAYGDDVRMIGYETSSSVSPGNVDTVCVHVTPTILEAIVMILVNQHFHHGLPLAIGSRVLQERAQATAVEAVARGRELTNSEELSAAISAYTCAIDLFLHAGCDTTDGDYASSLESRSECFCRQGQYLRAHVDASMALELRPDNHQLQDRLEGIKERCR